VAASSACALDEAVFAAAAALEERHVPAPSALLWSTPGLGLLTGRLEEAGRLPLERLPRVPTGWRDALLHWGRLAGLGVWMLEAPIAPAERVEAPWEPAWPVWLAAAAGASTLLHCSVCAALGAAQPGVIAVARDHLNLSGRSPLAGLGASRLGPMFPDQSLLHDGPLRLAALSACEKLGLVGLEAVFACVGGPALETPAEQRWHRTAGADVSVQGLAAPLLAAAHAGLGVLALSPVLVGAGERADVARLAATAQRLAPALEDLLLEVAAGAAERARLALEEPGP
jgi:purine-nucleoside phosphorylase